MEAAEYFQIEPPARPALDREPEDELRVYDKSEECPHCRYGWRQIADLTFNKSSLKDAYPVFRVFGRDEWIVHESIKDRLQDFASEISFRPVRQMKRGGVIADWHQLVIEARVDLAFPETLFGSDPLNPGPEIANLCPKGHTRGLYLCSEPYIKAGAMDGRNLSFSRDLVGGWDAINVPYALPIVSRKVRRALGAFDRKADFRFHRVRTVSGA